MSFAQNNASKNPTVDQEKKLKLHVDLFLGTFTNMTFGTHFSFYSSASLGFKEKNKVGIAFEKLLGDSKHTYQVFGDNELFATKNFGQYNVSLFYQRIMVKTSKIELSSYLAVSIDKIKIDANQFLENDKSLSGPGFEVGIGYDHLFKKKHSIPIMLIYHFSSIDNDKGSKLDPNYWGIRFTYNFHRSIN